MVGPERVPPGRRCRSSVFWRTRIVVSSTLSTVMPGGACGNSLLEEAVQIVGVISGMTPFFRLRVN